MQSSDFVRERVQAIVANYLQGDGVLWDAFCAIADHLTPQNIEDVFSGLPAEFQRQLAETAQHIRAGGKWMNLGSSCPRGDTSSRCDPPFSEDVQRTLRDWFVKNEKRISIRALLDRQEGKEETND